MAESQGEVCPVCIDDKVKYWAIGQCQHPVCFVCSTRMRVLCGKKECPTCRDTIEEVSNVVCMCVCARECLSLAYMCV